MPLTVKDILEKTFKKSFKGYDEDEVDKFLDQIIDEMKVLQSENAALREALNNEKERAQKIRETEETIMHTLVSAQKSAERIIKEATKKAETIIESAEATARKRAEQTTRDLADSQRKLDEIKKSAKAISANFAEMIRASSASFEEIYKNYFGDIEGGISVKALEKIDMAISESLKDLPETQEEGAAAPSKPVKPAEPVKPARGAEVKDTKPPALMEFTEINKALSELEEGGDDILQEEYPDEIGYEGSGKSSVYDEYSWLYDEKGKDRDVTVKDPKEKAELESLIDELIE